MKKKIIYIVIIVLVVIAVSIYLLTRPKELGNMNQRYAKQTTSTSNISFQGEAGDKIKISFSSRVINGDLDVFLNDSKGNVVYTLDRARELRTYYTFDYSDTYTLIAEYRNFTGRFDIKVYEVD